MFWKRVLECSHRNPSPNYAVSLPCHCAQFGMGATEYHCLDCGVYFTKDPCFEQDGLSGWPAKRRNAFWKKRAERRQETP